MSFAKSMLRISLVAMLFSLAFAASIRSSHQVAAQSEELYTISGTVLNFDDTPIEAANVSTDFSDPVLAFGSSDESGRYTLTVPAGTYSVRALIFEDGSTTPPTEVTVPPSQTDIDLIFQEQFTVSGLVLDGLGNPIEGARVLTDLDDPTSASTLTDPEGAYSLSLSVGDYTIRVFKAGLPGQLEQTLTVEGDTTGIDFQYPRSYQVSGTVVDENGVPLKDVTVRGGVTVTRTDESGQYAVLIREDISHIYFQKDGYTAFGSLSVPSVQDLTDVDKTLYQHTRAITGTVTDEDGEALAGVRIQLESLDRGYYANGYASTDEMGRYTTTVLSGVYWIIVEEDGYVPALPVELDLREESAEHNVTLAAASLTISGVVKDAAGQPVPDVDVDADACGIGYDERTDENGAFTILASPGTYTVSADDFDYGDTNEIMVTVAPTIAGLELVYPVQYTVVGRVTDSDGSALSQVEVSAWDDSAFNSAYADTDTNGVYTMTMPSGIYEFSIEEDGYARAVQGGIVVDEDRPGVQFQLSSLPWDQTIQGNVVDDAGNPVANIGIQAQLIEGQGWSDSQTVYYDGSFVMNLPAGTYSVRATGFGSGYTVSDAVEVTLPGDTDTLTLQVTRTDQLITGQAVDAEGEPVCGQHIRVGSQPLAVDFSERNGLYALAVPAGTHTVQAVDRDVIFDEQSVTVPTYALGLELRIDEASAVPTTFTVQGMVQDEVGQPLADATVEASNGSETKTATTGTDGSYSLALGSGTWTVTVQKAGYTSMTASQSIDVSGNQSDVAFSMAPEPTTENPDPENPDPENPGGNPINPADRIDLFLPFMSS